MRPNPHRRLAAVAITVTVAGCGGAHTSPTRPVTVPVTLAGQYGVAPVVRVRIDGGRPLPVLLDTGSTGLRVLARTVPAKQRRSTAPGATHTWATGAVTTERLIDAQVTIGAVSATHRVRVGIVDSVTCPPSSCEGWPSRVPDIVGTLGVSLNPGDGTPNPLLALAGGRGRSWRIDLAGPRPGLELGAPIPPHPAATFASSPNACWQIGTRTRRTCLSTAFDTGTPSVVGLNMSGQPPSARLVDPGTRVRVWANAFAPRPFWSFRSGYTPGRDLVALSGQPLATIVSGMPTFSAFAITLDAADGRQYLTRAVR